MCILALIFVFQPFSIVLFGIGAVAVIVGGLAFNLVAHVPTGACPLRGLVKGGLIVLTILVVVILLALGRHRTLQNLSREQLTRPNN